METIDFDMLPEGCTSRILSFTTPRDACRFSVLSPVFKSAADSDDLWEKILPSDYENVISRSSTLMDVNFSSKKELYFHLCDNPVFVDGDYKSFTLEKSSGKKCFMLGVRDFWITWQYTSTYWTFEADPSSRFPEVAVLKDVCWLEMVATLGTQFLSPNTLYDAYIVFKFNNDSNYGFSPASRGNVEVKFVEGGGGSGNRSFYFESNARRRRQMQARPNDAQYPQERGDGWMEIEMGHFFSGGEGVEEAVRIAVTDLSSHWKSGLIVQGMEFRPKIMSN